MQVWHPQPMSRILSPLLSKWWCVLIHKKLLERDWLGSHSWYLCVPWRRIWLCINLLSPHLTQWPVCFLQLSCWHHLQVQSFILLRMFTVNEVTYLVMFVFSHNMGIISWLPPFGYLGEARVRWSEILAEKALCLLEIPCGYYSSKWFTPRSCFQSLGVWLYLRTTRNDGYLCLLFYSWLLLDSLLFITASVCLIMCGAF